MTLNGNLSHIAQWSNSADAVARGEGPVDYTPTAWWTVENAANAITNSSFRHTSHNGGVEYITISDRIFEEALSVGSYGIIGVYTTIVLGSSFLFCVCIQMFC